MLTWSTMMELLRSSSALLTGCGCEVPQVSFSLVARAHIEGASEKAEGYDVVNSCVRVSLYKNKTQIALANQFYSVVY